MTREEKLQKALDVAVNMLSIYEPPDSRAVSGIFVALASVATGNENQECLDLIDEALAKWRKGI